MDEPDSRNILPDASNAQLMGPPPGGRVGAVVFTRGGTLMALPFDMKRLEAAGDAFPIAPGVAASGNTFYRLAATSNQGVLAYVSGQRGGREYVWRDRQGRNLGAFPGAGAVAMISPDGKRLVGDRDRDTWVLEFARGVATRLTFGPPGTRDPIWSSDGAYIAYRKGGAGIYRKPANGAGGEELLVQTKKLAVPLSWSPDGRFMVYVQINPETGADLLAIPVTGDRKPFVVVQTAATDNQGQFSPDGHWLAYTSNESGQSEIYAIPFPPSSSGVKWLVSRGGGVQPRWRRNGRELFYISQDSKMMSVEVTTQPVFQSGTPHALFQTEIVDTGIRNGPMSWDLAPDGNRFLIITANSSDTSSLTVALNWRVRISEPHPGSHLPRQRILHPRRRRLNQPAQLRLHLLHFALHLPGDLAIAEMPLHAAAQPRNIFGLGEIHLEQEPRPCAEWQQVIRRGRGQPVHAFKRRPHGCIVDLARARFRHQLRRVEAQFTGIGLAELLAAPVAMQVAIRAYIHDEVVGVEPAAESAQNLIAPRARSQGNVDHLGPLPPGPAACQLVQLPEGPAGHGVEQGGDDIGGNVGGPQQVHAVTSHTRIGRHVLLRPPLQILPGLHRVLVGFGMARQCGGQRFGAGVRVPHAVRLRGAGYGDLLAQGAQFRVPGSLQAADLFLHGPDTDHLSDVGRHAPEQQIPRHIESARRQVALIGLGLHAGRLRQAPAEACESQLLHLAVSRQ